MSYNDKKWRAERHQAMAEAVQALRDVFGEKAESVVYLIASQSNPPISNNPKSEIEFTFDAYAPQKTAKPKP